MEEMLVTSIYYLTFSDCRAGLHTLCDETDVRPDVEFQDECQGRLIECDCPCHEEEEARAAAKTQEDHEWWVEHMMSED